MINWKVRVKNKHFWIAIIAEMLLLVQVVLTVFGAEISFDALNGKLLAVVDAVFGILSVLGIVNDPTTAGIGDSDQALTYMIPKTKDGITE